MEQPLNSVDSSSDDMVNIQIEESLVRETLMAIDSNNFHEDLLTILCFGFILIFVLLTGIFGPPDTLPHSNTIDISQDTAIFEKKLPYTDFNSLNNHLAISIALTPKNKSQSRMMKVQFHYTIQCRNGKELVRTQNEKFKEYPVYYSSATGMTARIHLFNHTLITYDSLELNIIFEHAGVDFESFTVNFITGSPEHTTFQMYFRGIFSGIALLFLLFMLYSLRNLEFKLWHLEQKLTIPLLFLLFLYNDPLYIIHCYYPSIVVVIFDRLVYALFHSYLSFFILVLFDSLRYKNRKTDTCFFIPKIILCVLMFTFYAAHGIYDELHMYDEQTGRDPTENALAITELVLYLSFVVLAGFSIVASGIQVDVTERYKFNIYLSSGIIAVLIMAVAQILFSMRIIYGTSLSFVLKFATENVFTLLMAYFHWPYEVLQEQYDGTQNQEEQPEFFVNE